MTIRLLLCTGVFLVALAPAASASPITYDFRGNPLILEPLPLGTTATATVDGLTVTVRAFDENGVPDQLDRSFPCCGLGVGTIGSMPNQRSLGPLESIEFEFPLAVHVLSVTILEGGPSTGQIDFYRGGVLDTELPYLMGGGNSMLHVLNSDPGTTFQFVGVRAGQRIDALTVRPIPEPSAALLLGLGLLTLGRRGGMRARV